MKIRRRLTEDYGGGGEAASFAAGASDVGPYGGYGQGGMFGSANDLYNVFIDPVLNIVRVAAGKTKELGARAKALVAVTFEAVASTIIPFFEGEYEEIFEREKQELASVKSQYQRYYNAVDAVFYESDFMLLAFMYDPSAFLTPIFIRNAPGPIISLFNIVTGERFSSFFKDVKNMFSSVIKDSKLYEDEKDNKGKKDIGTVLSDDRVKKAVLSSKMVRGAAQATQKSVNTALDEAVQLASKTLQVRNLEDLPKEVINKLPKDMMKKYQTLEQNERNKTSALAMSAVRKALKAAFIKPLKDRAEQAVKDGVPQNHPYVVAHKNAIAKINAM